jgi:tRNA-specific 2-thiouridylase
MSGGVDSSVVAGLLARQGHEVIGITLQLYDHGEATGRAGSCCAGQDIHDARRVADRLHIAHYVLDYEERFRRSVMQSFADSYIKGETPVPCVACNSRIKFNDLLSAAEDLGAEALATGHYVERREHAGGPRLHRATDSDRDQSYFLFATTRRQLAMLRFPLGGLRKSEVRALATDLGIAVAGKPDSQDICFVPSGRYADVIERLRPGAAEPGDIVDQAGQVLGRHAGIVRFTVGQRKGLGVAGPQPLFVLRLDPDKRQVVVGPRSALLRDKLELRGFNWLGDDDDLGRAAGGLDVFARVRSTQAPEGATLFRRDDGTFEVELAAGLHGIAAGQVCALYADGTPTARILGGGWISATASKNRHASC